MEKGNNSFCKNYLVGNIVVISNAILDFLNLENIADWWSKLETQKAKLLFRPDLLTRACFFFYFFFIYSKFN